MTASIEGELSCIATDNCTASDLLTDDHDCGSIEARPNISLDMCPQTVFDHRVETNTMSYSINWDCEKHSFDLYVFLRFTHYHFFLHSFN